MDRKIMAVGFAFMLLLGTAVALTVDFDIILSQNFFLVYTGWLFDADLNDATVGDVRYIASNQTHQATCNAASSLWDTNRNTGVIQLEVISLIENGCEFFAELGGIRYDINAASSLYQFPIQATGDRFCIGYEVINGGRCVYQDSGDLNIVG